MKMSKKAVAVVALVSSLYGLSAAAECQSTATVNGKTYTSDKCNVSIVNGQVTFSDTPQSAPAIPKTALPSGLPASVQNLLRGLY